MGIGEDLKKWLAENTGAATDVINRGLVGGVVGAPVDIAATALRPFFPGISDNPVGGSEWIGQKMQQAGMVSSRRRPIAELAASLVDPVTMGAGVAKLGALGAAKLAMVGMFAGKGAKTANLSALMKAEQMKAAGVPDSQVWKETGWTLNTPDGKPRFEIPDNAAKVNPSSLQYAANNQDKNSVIGDIAKHPDLYSAYPDAKDIKLFTHKGSGAHFSEDGKAGRQSISLSTFDEPKSPTLHELQHAIQQREGFARGGSPEMFNQADEAKVAADALSWKRELLKKREAMPNADWSAVENAVVKDYQNVGIMDMLPSREARDLAAQPYILHGEKQYPEQLAKVEEMVKMYGLDKRTSPLKPQDAYERLAGEAEARLTQSRINLTPEERLAQYPYDPEYFNKATGVPLDSLIVRNEGGKAMSVPKTQYELAHEVAQRNAALPNGLHDSDLPEIRKIYEDMLMPNQPKNHLGEVIPPTKWQVNHAIARHNASLPIEQGGLGLNPNHTVMERAMASASDRANGFRDTPMFHGTSQDVDEFKLFHGGDVSRSPVGKLGVSLADNPELANEFSRLASHKTGDQAQNAGANVLPLLHRIDRGALMQLDDDVLNSEVFGAIVDAQKNGIDAIKMTNYTTPSGIKGQDAYLIQHPNQIRSRFAAFDPMQRNSANILAGGAAATFGLGMLFDRNGNIKD